MGGTQTVVEGAAAFYVDYLLDTSAPEGPQNSLKGGFNITNLQNRATCWANDVGSLYRWNEDSTATPDDVNVILPLGQNVAVAGRWLVELPGSSNATSFISATLAVGVNNYNPQGWDDADGIYITANGFPITVTGFVAPSGASKPHRKRVISDQNSTETLTLANLNGGSQAANQIYVGSTHDVADAGEGWDLIYDTTNSRWTALGSGGTS